MINAVLTYLHDFYGDGQFHDLTPLMKQNPPEFTEMGILNLHLDGYIEIKEPSVFENSETPAGTHTMYGKLTEKGLYYMEGNRKITAITKAIDDQLVLEILYKDENGQEEKVRLSPYIYGKDTEERAWVWGTVSGGDEKHRRFPLDAITITEEPLGTFEVDKEMKLSQPRDIEVVAQVAY